MAALRAAALRAGRAALPGSVHGHSRALTRRWPAPSSAQVTDQARDRSSKRHAGSIPVARSFGPRAGQRVARSSADGV